MNKTSKTLLLALGITLAGAGAANAQDQPATGAGSDGIWSLAEAINYATANNLQVQQSKVNRDLNKVNVNQSRFSRLPRVNGNANHNYSYGTTLNQTIGELRNEQYRSNSFSLNASVPLFMGFQAVNQIKQNSLALQASEQDILSAQNDITIQLITSYLNILFAQELIKTNELQRELTRQQLDRTNILFRAGSVAENSVLDLESQLATDELNVINAQNQRDIAHLNMVQLLNLKESSNFQIEIPEIPEPDQSPALTDATVVYETALQTLPAIKSAELRLQSASKAIDVARGAYLPTLSMNGGLNTFYNTDNFLLTYQTENRGFTRQVLGYTDAGGTIPLEVYTPNVVRTPIQNDYPFADQFNNNLGKQFGFSLQVPVFNGLQTRLGVQRAKLDQENARINTDIARNNLRQTIEQAHVDAIAAQRKYTAAKNQVIAAEKNYRNAELRLNSGVINTVDFNIVGNTYRSAQSSLLQAKYEYTFKLKVLDFYQGKDLSF
ncbi:TolC family protein [Pontibacter arcticus]|uniref:TolC family protein n=1 Tax=Pontibacter arcticus TaxID=2080288 RepID=A0A364RG24_9BACT|nr:TolC family protein [Pontibacter arcticus]RAU83217.1 TolC family protein [Pontibacter arcticus]